MSTGEIRWEIDLGGEQGFSFYPALLSGDLLILYSPEGATIAVNVADGSEVWVQHDYFPLAIGSDGAIYAGVARGGGVAVLGHADGEATTLVESSDVGMPVEGGFVQSNLLIVTGRLGAIGFDLTVEELDWRLDTPIVVAPPAITSEVIAMPIGNPRGIAVFEIP